MKRLNFLLSFAFVMTISRMIYVNPNEIKRLNYYLSCLWVWKILPFMFVIVISEMVSVK